MKTSSINEVCGLYEDIADSYAKMMDGEIKLPMYTDILGRLTERIARLPGPVVDTSCGSGHMLAMYHERFDPRRKILGVDLSPRMVEITRARLGAAVEALTGDMSDLQRIASGSAAALLSFFAIHHLDPAAAPDTLREWRRVLRPGGQLVIGAWEGAGPVDYEGETDVVALRYTRDQINDWADAAGFVVDRCVVEPVKGMTMDAVYLEGSAG